MPLPAAFLAPAEICGRTGATTVVFPNRPSYIRVSLRQNRLCRQFHRRHHMELQMGRTANDDRSDSMNPNNDSYDDSRDNRSDQLNPNNDRYQGNDDSGDDD